MEKKDILLKIFAEKIRLHSLKAMYSFGMDHVGGVLSIAEILAVLYGSEMYYDSKKPHMESRDRLVLSKGHCGPALYAVLGLSGFFPLYELDTLNKNGTILPSHCDMNKTPGIDMTTGSLGQGASTAAGLALSNKIKSRDAYTYLILGDGECNEGQVWEMAMFAAQQKLSNLITLVDFNHQQLDGYTKKICNMDNLKERFASFGFAASQIDGHDVGEIRREIGLAKQQKKLPSVILLDTVKGKGWSYTDGREGIHHINISAEQMSEAELEINLRIKDLEACVEAYDIEK